LLAKYSPSGIYQWSKRLGGPDTDTAYSVASDPQGNVLMAGASGSSSIDLGGGPLARRGSHDILLAKYSPAGAHLWSKRLGDTSGWGSAQSITSDSEGNVLVAGHYIGSSIDLGEAPLPSQGMRDIVLAKYSSIGVIRWSKRLGGSAGDEAYSVAADQDGNILVAGMSESSSIDLGGDPLSRQGYEDIVLVQYSAAGTHQWSKRLGGDSNDRAYSIAADFEGSVLVAGESDSSSINLGGEPLSRKSYPDIVLAKYSTSGDHLWSKRMGGNGQSRAYSVAADPEGKVLIAGENDCWIDLGGGTLGGPCYHPAMVLAEYSASGSYLWSKRLGGTDRDIAHAIASDWEGNVLLVGEAYSSSINLGGATLYSQGPEGWSDIVVAKYKGQVSTARVNRFIMLGTSRFSQGALGFLGRTGTANHTEFGLTEDDRLHSLVRASRDSEVGVEFGLPPDVPVGPFTKVTVVGGEAVTGRDVWNEGSMDVHPSDRLPRLLLAAAQPFYQPALMAADIVSDLGSGPASVMQPTLRLARSIANSQAFGEQADEVRTGAGVYTRLSVNGPELTFTVNQVVDVADVTAGKVEVEGAFKLEKGFRRTTGEQFASVLLEGKVSVSAVEVGGVLAALNQLFDARADRATGVGAEITVRPDGSPRKLEVFSEVCTGSDCELNGETRRYAFSIDDPDAIDWLLREAAPLGALRRVASAPESSRPVIDVRDLFAAIPRAAELMRQRGTGQLVVRQARFTGVEVPLSVSLNIAGAKFGVGVNYKARYFEEWESERWQPRGGGGWERTYSAPPPPQRPWVGVVGEYGQRSWDAVRESVENSVRQAIDEIEHRIERSKEWVIDHTLNPTLTLEGPAGSAPTDMTVITTAAWPGGARPSSPVPFFGLDVVGAVYSTTPAVELDAPAKVSITFEDDFLGDVSPADLAIYRLSPTGWTRLPSVPGPGLVQATTQGLGTFALGVDREAPSISFVSPTDQSHVSNSQPTIVFTVDDGLTDDPPAVTAFLDGVPLQLERDGMQYVARTGTSLSDGEHTIRVEARDVAGNAASSQGSFGVDTSAPAPPGRPFARRVNGGVEIQWEATTGATEYVIERQQLGVDDRLVPIAATDGVTVLDPQTLNGVTALYGVRARDEAGNLSELAGPISVDDVAPTTSLSLEADGVRSGPWSGSSWEVSFQCIDVQSHCEATFYAMDGGPDVPYRAPFRVDTEGLHTLRFLSIDRAGNREATRTAMVGIDRSPPVTTPAAAATRIGEQGWTSGQWTLQLDCKDPDSGFPAGSSDCGTTWFSLGLEQETEYAAPVAIESEGRHHIDFRSADSVQNAEQPSSIDLGVDKQAPTTHMTTPDSTVFFSPLMPPVVTGITLEPPLADGSPGSGIFTACFQVAGALIDGNTYGGNCVEAHGDGTTWSAALDLPSGVYDVTLESMDLAHNKAVSSPVRIIVLNSI
jgi:hypothetical protein